ncbi:hypothetical protein LDO26_01055 [Luteimonas sp. BDR2-5]|uniref:hypothetical protein n=1 Tax=Proluteimonas luteida TaxID=2878685 RepID=UPI001E409AAB|nr:hypothetical protein [Luteimonas sp. BDR2-5]MCD9026804.1 hypothetical protein [Luteimonas sp. BDR2-5]
MPVGPGALSLVLLAVLAASAQAEAPSPDARRLPIGASIEASGFATILTAPPAPYPDQPPASNRDWVDPDTAMRREMNANPPEAAHEAALALARKLEAGEGRNYIGVRIVRDPDPRFAFQFRTDAAATLARYTDDPRFVAVEGGVPVAELRPLADEWNARFAPHRLGVGNVYEFDGVVRFDMQVDEATFRAIAEAEGWRLPERVELVFTPAPNPSALDPALEPLVRIMPRHDRVPGAVLQALMSGHVLLRDGCFRLAAQAPDSEEALVIFDRDIALVLDDEGYMALQGSRTDQPLPRIGEPMTWAGPRGVDERDAGVGALRAACGEGEIVSVGTPSSAHHSRVRPWILDQLVRDHGMTRQEAWDALRRCWALADEAGLAVHASQAVGEQCGLPPSYL